MVCHGRLQGCVHLPPSLKLKITSSRVGSTAYSRSPTVGHPVASILKSSVSEIPALFDANPVSNSFGGVYCRVLGMFVWFEALCYYYKQNKPGRGIGNPRPIAN